MSKINELDLHELLQLKEAVSNINEKLAQKLTNYAVMYNDAYFQNIPDDLKDDYSKRLKYTKLNETIDNIIEERINEYF